MSARVAFVITAAIALGACHEDYPPCYRGDYSICTCGGTTYGYQACKADQSGYEACLCNGATPGIDAGCEGGACADR